MGIVNRLAELRRKLTLEDFLLIVAIMYTDNLVQMLLRFVNGVLQSGRQGGVLNRGPRSDEEPRTHADIWLLALGRRAPLGAVVPV